MVEPAAPGSLLRSPARWAARGAVAVLVLALTGGAVRAQPGAPRFERLSRAEGLSNGYVFDLLQDRSGFLWVATADGLNRYDGYGFTVYRRVPFASGSLPSSYVYSLHEDRDGGIWVGTHEALSRADAGRDAFVTYELPRIGEEGDDPVVLGIEEDGQGRIWAASLRAGAYRVDRATGEVVRFGHDEGVPTSLSHDRAYTVFRDRGGRVWVGTQNGLNRHEPSGGFTRFLTSAEGGGRSQVWRVVEDARQPPLLWVGTGDGLLHFDPRTGAATPYTLRPPGSGTPVPVFDLAADRVAPHVLWVATASGLVRFRTDDHTFERYQNDPGDDHSLSSDYIGSLLVDRSGTLWVGTRAAGGLNRFDPATSTFVEALPPGYVGRDFILDVAAEGPEALWLAREAVERVDRRTGAVTVYPLPGLVNGQIDVLHLDRRGIVWVGTEEHGLNRLDPRRGTFTAYRHAPGDPGTLSSDDVKVIYEARDGALWVGTVEGVNRLDPTSGRITRFVHDPAEPRSLLGDAVNQILEDRAGAIWVAANGGLSRIEPSSGRVTRYAHDHADPATLGGQEVWTLFEDPAGAVWAGTRDGGLSRVDPATGRVTRYGYDPARREGLSSDVINALYVRRREPGVVWVGTEGAGLDRLDVRTGTVRHFHAAEGFPGTVYGFLEDEDGRLWVGTSGGLVRLDPATGAFRLFGRGSGALDQFWYHSQERGPGGELVFWSSEGVIAFHPRHILDNPTPPAVVLTGLRVFSEPVSASGPLAALYEGFRERGQVRLAHDQDALTFEFVGLHFKDPARNRYRYRLEGFDRGWIEAGAQRTAAYTNLPPGRYTFRVRAANSDGVWNEEGASVRVVIAPPWWHTWWAYGLYALLFVGAAAGALWGVRRRAIRREREAAQERELAQARALEGAYHALDASHRELKTAQDQLVHQEKMASLGRLTAGIAHEIKNPLNFVNNFAQLSGELVGELRETLAPHAPGLDGEVTGLLDALGENVGKIEEHGRRADGIVRSMLAHSRTGGGARHPVDLNAVVEEYAGLAYHGLRAANPAFRAHLDLALDAATGALEAATQDLGRIVLNLVNNALYAVHQNAARRDGTYTPTVRVVTRPLGDAVEVRVEDNGPGIPAAIRERIFEPFFTTKPSGEGTGLGLSITYDIVTQGYGGTLAVESEEGVGTTFVLCLPRALEAGRDQSAGAERAASAADGTSLVTSTSAPASRSGR